MWGRTCRRRVSRAAILFALTGCEGKITGPVAHRPDASDGASGELDVSGAGGAEQRMITRTFEESDAYTLDPERGFYLPIDLLSPGSAASLRSDGYTLGLALVRLDGYRDRPLGAALLASLDEGFAAVRAAGVKVILRFAYNHSFGADAPKHRILGHIAQLEPLLQANADVIATMQAGFIGAWGEWHSSSHGLDNEADGAEILDALLAALPPSRSVQIRTPMLKDAIFPGGPLTATEALSGSDRARVGHHNDCFLSSADDLGTYADPVGFWKGYLAADGRFAPIGGETCRVYEPRTLCQSAVPEMAAQHWSYLNRDYNPAVIDAWIAGGCEAEIHRRLGYRFTLERVAHTEAVAPGGRLALEVDVANRGFAAPYNERPVHVVVSGSGERWAARLGGADPRRWAPGESTTLAAELRIPAGVTPGVYSVSLWLPDPAASLTNDPRYAIRFANDGVWDSAGGENALTRELWIDPSAPGPVDLSVAELVELP